MHCMLCVARPPPARTLASAVALAQPATIRDLIFAKFDEHLGMNGAAAAGGGPAVAGSKRPRSAMSGSGTPGAVPGPVSAASLATAALAAARDREEKLAAFRGTPIIIVPNAPTSLISIYNAAAFLERGTFVPPAEAEAAATSDMSEAAFAGAARTRPSKVTITHRDAKGLQWRFHIIDDVSLLTRNDWCVRARTRAYVHWKRDQRNPIPIRVSQRAG